MQTSQETSKRAFALRSDWRRRLANGLGAAAIETGDRQIEEGGAEHDRGKEEEVGGARQLGRAIRILDEEVDGRVKTLRGRSPPNRCTSRGTSFPWRLGVGEFQMRDRHQNLRGGEDQEGEDLPEDVRMSPASMRSWIAPTIRNATTTRKRPRPIFRSGVRWKNRLSAG